MKICTRCGNLTSYNSYFGCYYCTNCGKLDAVKNSLKLNPRSRKSITKKNGFSKNRAVNKLSMCVKKASI